MTRTVADWKGPDLSLPQPASGTNLTAANHVMLGHPMLARTQEKAVSFEMQAIGRARRHGQLRDTVHVWRFVTVETVEEELTKLRFALSADSASLRAAHTRAIGILLQQQLALIERASTLEEELGQPEAAAVHPEKGARHRAASLSAAAARRLVPP